MAYSFARIGLGLLGTVVACSSDNPLYGRDYGTSSDGGGATDLEDDTDSGADDPEDAGFDDDGDTDDDANDDDGDTEADEPDGCSTIVLSATDDTFVVGNGVQGNPCVGADCGNNYGHTAGRAVVEGQTDAAYLIARFNTIMLRDLGEVVEVRLSVQLGDEFSQTAELYVYELKTPPWEEGTNNAQPGKGEACWQHSTDGQPWGVGDAEFGGALVDEIGWISLAGAPDSPGIPLELGGRAWIDSGTLDVAVAANIPTLLLAKSNPDVDEENRVQLIVEGCP